MSEQEPLLTVVVEAAEPLGKESTTYRRLMSARLQWESSFDITVVGIPLTTSRIAEICAARPSKYVVFVKQSHQISATYLNTILKHLNSRTVYMVEPFVYSGPLPNKIGKSGKDLNLIYDRDTDIYGVVFNTGRLSDALDAVSDIDRTAIYLAYRLYWSINDIAPLEAGYSVASVTKSAIGLTPGAGTDRLLPLIPSSSMKMRLHILRLLVLFLRGLRESELTDVSLGHLRDIVGTYQLTKYLDYAEPMHPFECAWIKWLDDSHASQQLFKYLSGKDAYLEFSDVGSSLGSDIELHQISFGDETVSVGKSYLPRESRPEVDSPEVYDFYSRPITANSTILFFDRPMQADDNAEYLYAHFRTEHPEYTNAYFALNPKSPDWARLDARGFQLVPFFSTEFYEIFLRSDLVVSSQIYNLRYRGKNLANSRFVYLQHGVQLNDMSNWVASKHFDVFVATGKVEADYLSTVAPVETLNSGLPRLQTLRPASGETGNLLFMPTWRFNLHQVGPENFRDSTYFQAIDAVLTDARLLAHLEATESTLHVKLHPNMEKRADHFNFSSRVVRSSSSYREAISAADFVFTDYSSAVIDAAFVGTPIAYYQWDDHDFFAEQPYESRLDYTEDGLGPVFTAHEELIDHIVTATYRETQEEYTRRREHFFEGVDIDRINDTIIERMLSL